MRWICAEVVDLCRGWMELMWGETPLEVRWVFAGARADLSWALAIAEFKQHIATEHRRR